MHFLEFFDFIIKILNIFYEAVLLAYLQNFSSKLCWQ